METQALRGGGEALEECDGAFLAQVKTAIQQFDHLIFQAFQHRQVGLDTRQRKGA